MMAFLELFCWISLRKMYGLYDGVVFVGCGGEFLEICEYALFTEY